MLLPLTKKVLCTQNRHKSSFVVSVIRHFSGFLLYFATKIYINVLPGCKVLSSIFLWKVYQRGWKKVTAGSSKLLKLTVTIKLLCGLKKNTLRHWNTCEKGLMYKYEVKIRKKVLRI